MEPLFDADGPIPPSPCIGVCKLDAQGHCLGCRRTGAEILAYGERVAAARQWRAAAAAVPDWAVPPLDPDPV